MKKILFVIGTRPEAIKMSPLIKTFKEDADFSVTICTTGQHREMLKQVLDFFDITPDINLELMRHNQDLTQLTTDITLQISQVLEHINPHYVFIQGDTTTVLASALAAFYKKIKIIHIEAGLRSGNLYAPFPEEANRMLVSKLAYFHFCPTALSANNLKKEGITKNVYTVGNTVIDALLKASEIVERKGSKKLLAAYKIDFSKKIVLVTCHRRENFGKALENICQSLMNLIENHRDVQIVYPVHLNPNVKEIVEKRLNHPNILLIPPLSYPELVSLIKHSELVLTDSGGIQEEAPSLNKPVLVLRDITERIEGIESGTAQLVGTDSKHIYEMANRYLTDDQIYKKTISKENPYGDGHSSKRILETIKLDQVK